MNKKWHLIFVSILSLIVTSCASETKPSYPKIMSFTPASVVVDYSNNDLHEATNLAQQFCSSLNKDAQYVRTDEKNKTLTAFFNCIDSSSHRNHQNSGTNNSPAPAPIINNIK